MTDEVKDGGAGQDPIEVRLMRALGSAPIAVTVDVAQAYEDGTTRLIGSQNVPIRPLMEEAMYEIERLRALAALSAAPVETVTARHPAVIRWRNDGIEACAQIADRYQCEDAARDMRRLATDALSAVPSPGDFAASLKEITVDEAYYERAVVSGLTEEERAALIAEGPGDLVFVPSPTLRAQLAPDGLAALKGDAT